MKANIVKDFMCIFRSSENLNFPLANLMGRVEAGCLLYKQNKLILFQASSFASQAETYLLVRKIIKLYKMFLVRFYVLAEIGKSSSFPIFNIAVLYFPEPVG